MEGEVVNRRIFLKSIAAPVALAAIPAPVAALAPDPVILAEIDTGNGLIHLSDAAAQAMRFIIVSISSDMRRAETKLGLLSTRGGIRGDISLVGVSEHALNVGDVISIEGVNPDYFWRGE